MTFLTIISKDFSVEGDVLENYLNSFLCWCLSLIGLMFVYYNNIIVMTFLSIFICYLILGRLVCLMHPSSCFSYTIHIVYDVCSLTAVRHVHPITHHF